VALFIGWRDIDWKALFRPLAPNVVGPIENVGYSMWISDKDGARRFGPLNLINPVVLVIVPNLLYGISQIPHSVTKHGHKFSQPYIKTGYWQCVAWVDGSIVALALGITLIALLIIGVISLVSMVASNERLADSRLAALVKQKVDHFIERRKQAKVKRSETIANYERQRLLDIQKAVAEMTCGIDSSQVSVAALPKKKQTVRLRASQAKVALCKPFAR
jgi:hypothetical protein